MVFGQHTTGPLSPRTAAKSFCTLLPSNFQPKSPSMFRGEPAICFSKEEISQLAAPLKFTLVGKFSYRRPKMEVIRKFFISLGLKSLKSVGLVHENHIAIFITQEEDYSRLLLRSTWYISGAPMKVLKWSSDFYPNFESPVVPVWVGFPGLPLHYFEKSALFSIASVFGSPLKMDEPTALLSRPTVARVCIEVDVSKPLSHRLWIGDEKDGYWQDVIFENPPLYCSFCKALGHEDKCCHFKNPSLRTGQDKQSKEKEHPASSVQENQKEKGKEKHEMVWKNKVKEDLLLEKPDEGEWTVVRRKNRKTEDKNPTSLIPGAVVVKDAIEISKAENPSFPQMPTTEEKLTRDNRASVVPEKGVQSKESGLVVLGKAGEMTSDHLPPLLRHYISSSSIALTPLPDLTKINQRKKEKNGNGDPSEPNLMKHRDTTSEVPISSPLEEFQKASSQLVMPEMGKDLQAKSLLSRPCTIKSLPLDASQVSSQPLLMNVREDQIIIQPCDQTPTKIGPSDSPALNRNTHLPPKFSVNKETDGNVSLVEGIKVAETSANSTAIPSVSKPIFQVAPPSELAKSEGSVERSTAGRPNIPLQSDAGNITKVAEMAEKEQTRLHILTRRKLSHWIA